VLKTAARQDFVRHALPVWIDLTPPEITFAYKAKSNGEYILSIYLYDAISGLDLSSFTAESSNAVLLKEPEKSQPFPKSATYKYTISESEENQQEDSSSGFKTQQVDDDIPVPPPVPITPDMFVGVSDNNNSRTTKESVNTLKDNLLESECKSQNGNITLKKALDIRRYSKKPKDQNHPDITFILENTNKGGRWPKGWSDSRNISYNSDLSATVKTNDNLSKYTNCSWTYKNKIYTGSASSVQLENIPMTCSYNNKQIKKTQIDLVNTEIAIDGVSGHFQTKNIKPKHKNLMSILTDKDGKIDVEAASGEPLFLGVDLLDFKRELKVQGKKEGTLTIKSGSDEIKIKLKLTEDGSKWESVKCQ